MTCNRFGEVLLLSKYQLHSVTKVFTLFLEEPSADYHLCDIRCQALQSLGLRLQRRVERISTAEQCGVLGILCHTGHSLQEGLSALRINRVCL